MNCIVTWGMKSNARTSIEVDGRADIRKNQPVNRIVSNHIMVLFSEFNFEY